MKDAIFDVYGGLSDQQVIAVDALVHRHGHEGLVGQFREKTVNLVDLGVELLGVHALVELLRDVAGTTLHPHEALLIALRARLQMRHVHQVEAGLQ